MLYFVIEKFRHQDGRAVYRRLRDEGRMVPDGLVFHDSWIAADLSRCFQVMSADDIGLLQRWVGQWSDLVEFEIVPVQTGKETAAALADHLDD